MLARASHSIPVLIRGVWARDLVGSNNRKVLLLLPRLTSRFNCVGCCLWPLLSIRFLKRLFYTAHWNVRVLRSFYNVIVAWRLVRDFPNNHRWCSDLCLFGWHYMTSFLTGFKWPRTYLSILHRALHSPVIALTSDNFCNTNGYLTTHSFGLCLRAERS